MATDEALEWKKLKKGHVITNPSAGVGEALMHTLVGGGYTGSLLVAPVGEHTLVGRYDEAELLILVDRDGKQVRTLQLPPNTIAWRAIEAPELDTVLLKLDHGVFTWKLGDDSLTQLAINTKLPASFLTLAGTRTAWFDGTHAVVHDLATHRDIARIALTPVLYSGHTPQMCGALSPDGKVLAVCATPGELLIVNADSGAITATLEADIGLIERMQFTPDGKRLLVVEAYGGWSLWQHTIGGAELTVLENHTMPLSMAISRESGRIAIADRKSITVREPDGVTELCGFTAAHSVKRSDLAWIDAATLAVRTDRGCLSLYRV